MSLKPTAEIIQRIKVMRRQMNRMEAHTRDWEDALIEAELRLNSLDHAIRQVGALAGDIKEKTEKHT